jgi:DSF synthase
MADVRLFPRSQFQQLETRFDVDYGAIWGFMKPSPRPTFNLQLLRELRGYIDSIVDPGGVLKYLGRDYGIEYALIASKTPGVFNLGGDLELFRNAIQNRDRDALLQYGSLCVDNLYPWSQNCGLPITTIALVQGDAMGGGFECALSSTYLIAEESSRMGFPEVLFNLFPGMGAYSYLVRKVGRKTTEELITSGNMYTGRQLFDLGVVDVLAQDGAGEAAVYAFIRKHSRSSNGRRAVERVRRELQPITYEELTRIVEVWANAALELSERDIRMMDRLVRAQNRSCFDENAKSDRATVVQLQRYAN